MSHYLYLEDLYTEREDLNLRLEETINGGDVDPLTDEEEIRLHDLNEICDELDLDNKYNRMETAIPESEWVAYAEQTADDLGMVDAESSMCAYIDWERFADDLKMDYTSFEFEGETYYARFG